VGQVVDTVGVERKQVYQGKEYDYVFDVDLGDGGPLRKLPYRVTGREHDVVMRRPHNGMGPRMLFR
jgi:phospholipase A-2-activating protein